MMDISEYQAKREALEKKLREIGEQEAEHKMELSVKHQMQLKSIAAKIGQLKHQRAETNKRYEMDKAWTHRRYRDEKQKIISQIHMLRMEYLTVNGVQSLAKIAPPKPEQEEQHEEV